ncbi:MAG: acyl carrier protein [Planctomycetota bacterium]|jgi:acyl carrier protein
MQTGSDTSSRACPSRNQVVEDVKRIIGEQMGISPEGIREADELVNDIGCDSLDVMEIAMEVEGHFDVTVPDDMADTAKTVAAVADGVVELIRVREGIS